MTKETKTIIENHLKKEPDKIVTDEKTISDDEFVEIVNKNMPSPTIAKNVYGNETFSAFAVMSYIIIDNELKCFDWKGDILTPPLGKGQCFNVCSVKWNN